MKPEAPVAAEAPVDVNEGQHAGGGKGGNQGGGGAGAVEGNALGEDVTKTASDDKNSDPGRQEAEGTEPKKQS